MAKVKADAEYKIRVDTKGGAALLDQTRDLTCRFLQFEESYRTA
ncbi:MAG TPA: hypothetical protein VJ749_06250 [Pyrinomonadaceae bacterium]|nr:hypothetical protein [Pyrinomonadaceae bacterium]